MFAMPAPVRYIASNSRLSITRPISAFGVPGRIVALRRCKICFSLVVGLVAATGESILDLLFPISAADEGSEDVSASSASAPQYPIPQHADLFDFQFDNIT
jgi:hypothetical protein